jgi:hypothetical protein
MPAKKISKEDAKNLIIKCRKRVETTMPLIPSSSAGNKYKHPRLGMLNAKAMVQVYPHSFTAPFKATWTV